MESKTLTLEPLGLVTQPNKLGQYPDGAFLVGIGVVFDGAGSCESAPEFTVDWSIDAGDTVLAAEVIPTPGYTLVLIKLAAGWRYCWVDDAGVASPLEVAQNAYDSNVNFEVDDRVDWCITRDRVFVTSTTGPMVFDYLRPTTAAERAPRIAGMFAPALTATPVTGSDKSAIKAGNHAHVVMVVTRHFPDCYEVTGPPSAAAQIRANQASDVNVLLQVLQRPGHPQLLAGDTVEAYRTIQVRAPVNDGLPEDYDEGISTTSDYYLSSVFTIPDPPSAFFHQWEEATGDQNLGTALYTNAGVVGASAQKRPPPICRAIEEYRNYTFYLDITEPAVRVARVGAGLGQLTDTYSQTWGVGERSGPTYDTVEVNGSSHRMANADDLAALDLCNVDDLARVNPDTPGIWTTPATGFAFRFDYAAAGNLELKASNGQNYQPPLPTLAEAAEVVEPPRRENGFGWTEEGQPEAVTQYGIASTGRVYTAVATSVAMIVFTSQGLYRLSGSGGSSSAGFDWALDHIDSQVMLRGPLAVARLGDNVFAATNNGCIVVDGGGVVREISTSALGNTGAKAQYSSTDKTRVVADNATGDVYFSFDDGEANIPYVYSTRWNKWSRVVVAPTADVVGSSELKKGMTWMTREGNTLVARSKSATNYQQGLVRFQPNFAGAVDSLKRFIEVEWYFHGSAFGQPIKLIANSLTGIERTLREHAAATTPTHIQAGITSAAQSDASEFSLAQTSIEIPRNAPAVSNSISLGYVTPAGTTKYTFFGCALVANLYNSTRRGRRG